MNSFINILDLLVEKVCSPNKSHCIQNDYSHQMMHFFLIICKIRIKIPQFHNFFQIVINIERGIFCLYRKEETSKHYS